MSGKLVLMQGNEACVHGALYAGMSFYAGYPITPSTEIAEISSEILPLRGGSFIQMEDEISSMAAIIGASAMGTKSMTATSGPGFSLMQENIGYASMIEMPCVVVDVQRAGPSTCLPTSPSQGDVMQARWGTHGDHPIIALAPSTVEECFRLTVEAFNLSEKYRVPVIFLMDEIIGHLREGIRIPEQGEIKVVDRKLPDPQDETWLPYNADPETLVPSIPPFGTGRRYHMTGLAHDERGYPTNSNEKTGALCNRLMQKIQRNADDIISWEETDTDDAEIVLVCYGGTVRAARKAMKDAREKGLKVGIFRPITIWPFPEKQLKVLAGKAKHIIVVEHNYGQLYYEIDRLIKNDCGLSFVGCVDGSVIQPKKILGKIEEVSENV